MGETWFEASDAYGTDRWMALRQAVADEPAMGDVFDACPAWRYDLPPAMGHEAAAEALLRIADEARRRGYYTTAGLAARALCLGPKTCPIVEVPSCFVRNFSGAGPETLA
ncbi:MAG: hypothetical protein ACOC95_06915 [Planctomycetota bacterium]